MATIIDEDVMRALTERAGHLMAGAFEVAEVQIGPGATDDDILASRNVQALCMSVQALVRTTPFSEQGMMVGLASVCGLIMAQCESDRHALYKVFQKQFADTMREIAEALPAMAEPMGRA